MKQESTSAIVSAELEQIQKHQEHDAFCLSTGFTELDKWLGGYGLEPGTITVIGARPSMGKTSLILNMINHQLRLIGPNESILYINSREGKANLIQRLLALSSQINIEALQLRQLSAADKKSLSENTLLPLLQQDNLLIETSPKFNIAAIEALVQKTHADKQLKILIIDTIQSVDAEKSKDVDEGYYFIMNSLKQLAITYNIPVLICSDIHRRVEWAKEGRVPKLDDLLGSAHIGHMADNCLMLVRSEYYQVPGEYSQENPTEAHLILKKSKNGHPETVIKLDVDLKKQLFLSRDVSFKELLHRYSM